MEANATPPPPPPPPPVSGQPNTAMLVLSYLGLLALIPLLVEKNDKNVQWHAKHGLVLTAVWVVVYVGLMVMAMVVHALFFLIPLVGLAWFVLIIVAILKAVKGERLIIPGISEFADKF